MKKLIILTFAITALLLGAIAIQAQPVNKKYKKAKVTKKTPYKNAGYPSGKYNYRGVYTYYTTKFVWKHGRKFKNTYKVNVLRNGRKRVKLIESVPVRRHYGKRVFYRTRIVTKGWKKYRVTYKITRFPNGRVKKKVVKKVRIYNTYKW